MKKKHSKLLVIDTDIARASGGEDAVYPTSKHCRDLLKAVLEICHHVVMSPSIYSEWKRHESRFARTWRVSMVARRKVRPIADEIDDTIRNRILISIEGDKNRRALEKDAHLIEAALSTDKIILSLDNTAKRLFEIASKDVQEIRDVIWVNPDLNIEETILWLSGGANRH
jgi:hypothetical protein